MTSDVMATTTCRADDGGMTTTHSSAHDLAAASARSVRRDPVRTILAVDAGVCVAAGVALVASASVIADRADLAGPSAVRVIGAFLLVLGIAAAKRTALRSPL